MRDTLHALRTGERLNARLYTFVKKFITPAVLLAGLLILVVVHFKGVLAITTSQNDLYHGVTSYSAGSLQMTFQHNAGTDRPNISYDNVDLLTFVDWSSTISVDGQVQNLWDNFHGYDADTTKHQVFATTTGYGWQVVEIVTLVDSHTVTVQYDFMATHQGIASPRHAVLNIAHTHKTWYQPVVRGNTFTTQVLPRSLSSIDGTTSLPHAIGTLTLTLDGPDVPATNAISLDDLRGYAISGTTEVFLATSMTTTYIIDNPEVDRLTPLGTETITFQTTVPSGTPVPAPVATP